MTEREHERMVSELTAKHIEELSQLRTEVSSELRESMEAAHQAELQQAQVYYTHRHFQPQHAVKYHFYYSVFPPLHNHFIAKGSL